MLRDPLSNAHHEPNLRLNRLPYPRRGNRRRHENRTRIRASLFDRIRYILEHRTSEMFFAGFLGVRAAYDIGAVFDRLLRVESTLPTREALEDYFSLIVYS